MTVKGQLSIAGTLAGHELARPFAEEVRRVHHRYATEVVGAFRLCPFMNDAETAFGRFVVVLDTTLGVAEAADLVLESGVQVVHLVYPLIDVGPQPFERFGNEVHQRVARAAGGGPVHATFHPHMDGDGRSASRLVGLLRRAPDPFVQFVPEGLHEGGTVFADLASVDLKSFTAPKDRAIDNYSRLSAEAIERVADLQADIRTDRDRSYASYEHALGSR